MHSDIEELINIAKDGGELTEKQKEIILRKAEKLGEDVDKVEMFIETLIKREGVSSAGSGVEKKMKCPNCGAVISETTFMCPECGYTLQKENKASEDARKLIDRFQVSLQEAEKETKKTDLLDPAAPFRRQARVVNALALPTTKEGLMQLLEFSFSNYISIKNDYDGMYQKPLKDAWYGKTLQAVSMLDRIGKNDSSIQAIVKEYKRLLRAENRKLSGRVKFIAIGLLLLAGLVLICIPAAKRERASHDRVEQFLQEGNYQGARNAAETYSDKIKVSEAEVLYLIREGDFQKARIVASTIEDKGKKKEMLDAIDAAERQIQ